VGHVLRLANRLLDGARGHIDIGNHATPHALRRHYAHPDHTEQAVFADSADERADLGRANVDTGDDTFHSGHAS